METKWHSLLKNPHDLPQHINRFEESEDVMVIEKYLNDTCDGFEYGVFENTCYYGHWEPNGEEGWRVRGKNYSDCGKFGGFDTDVSYRKDVQIPFGIDSFTLENDYTKEEQDFIKNNCKYDKEYNRYITREIAGWTYYPNKDEFIEENKEFIYHERR